MISERFCRGEGPHQIIVGEPGDLLLDAVLHLGLRGQRPHVVQDVLLLLQVLLQQLDLSVQSLQLIPVLPGLGLQLGLQEPDGTRELLTHSNNTTWGYTQPKPPRDWLQKLSVCSWASRSLMGLQGLRLWMKTGHV